MYGRNIFYGDYPDDPYPSSWDAAYDDTYYTGASEGLPCTEEHGTIPEFAEYNYGSGSYSTQIYDQQNLSWGVQYQSRRHYYTNRCDGRQRSGERQSDTQDSDEESSEKVQSSIRSHHRRPFPFSIDEDSRSRRLKRSRKDTTPPVFKGPSPPRIPTEPSREYIASSLEPSEPIADPGTCRKLLILDLNGSLLVRAPHQPPPNYNHKESGPFDPYKDHTAPRPLRVVYPRPYMPSFREYLFHPETQKWLDTMVWSSAQPHNVHNMVDKAFGDKKGELIAVWSRDTLGLSKEAYHLKTQTTKDLAKPWAALDTDRTTDKSSPLDSSRRLSATISPSVHSSSSYPPSAPLSLRQTRSSRPQAQRHSAMTTVLLDDSPLKARLQPWNHVCILEYTREMREQDLATLRLQAMNEEERHEKGKTVEDDTIDYAAEDNGEYTESKTGGLKPKPKKKHERSAKKREREREAMKNISDSTKYMAQAMTACSGEEELLPPTKLSHLTPVLQSSVAVAGSGFDETLLAVIGILDTLKLQSNVASWIQSGSLNRRSVDPDAASSDVVDNILQLNDHNQDFTTSIEKQGVFTSEEGPQQSRNSADLEPRPEASESRVKLMWFDNRSNVLYWTAKGRQALAKLGIPLDHGITESELDAGAVQSGA